MKKGGMLCVLLAALLVFLCAFPVSAGNSTANTYTVSVNWEWIKTQDAYLPGQVYFKDEGLNRPSDIVVMNMKMYVADSDNGRILIKDLNDREKPTEILGEGIVNRPTGIMSRLTAPFTWRMRVPRRWWSWAPTVGSA